LRQLSEIGLDHVGLCGKVDKLLVGHCRSFSGLLLCQHSKRAKSDAADGQDYTFHLISSPLPVLDANADGLVETFCIGWRPIREKWLGAFPGR
jgi:hypothetical protein